MTLERIGRVKKFWNLIRGEDFQNITLTTRIPEMEMKQHGAKNADGNILDNAQKL